MRPLAVAVVLLALAGCDSSSDEPVEKKPDPLDSYNGRVIRGWLLSLDRWQRFILLKLLAGELRLGVSQTLVVRALAQAADLPTTTIAARLMGDWQPTANWFASLIAPGVT